MKRALRWLKRLVELVLLLIVIGTVSLLVLNYTACGREQKHTADSDLRSERKRCNLRMNLRILGNVNKDDRRRAIKLHASRVSSRSSRSALSKNARVGHTRRNQTVR